MTKKELFLSKELWEETIYHAYDKGISVALLEMLASPFYRESIWHAFETDSYEVSIPYVGWLPKDDGTLREVLINEELDRVVFSHVTRVYFKMYGHLVNRNCTSYQKGLSVASTVKGVLKQACGLQVGVKLDLSKYFDTVPIEIIERVLHQVSTDEGIDRVLWKYYHTNLVSEKGIVKERYKSLAQGCAFASFLADVILKGVDEWCSENCTVYRRYSDDILILDADWESKLAVVENRLQSLGLTVNKKKTTIIREGEPFTFLGVSINGNTVTISPNGIQKYKKTIRGIIKRYSRMKNKRFAQEKAIDSINAFVFGSKEDRGWLSHYASVCNTVDDFRMLDNFTKNSLKKLYTGKNNYTVNQHKTSNELLRQMGYKSLVHFYQCYKFGKDLYKAELKRCSLMTKNKTSKSCFNFYK